MIDITNAANEFMRVAKGIDEEDLQQPTPCPQWTVSALLDHVLTSAQAFTSAARKEQSQGEPSSDADQLPEDWQPQLEQALQDLVDSWRDPTAWEGTTEAGGKEMPAADMGVVALDELVLHGWDLARATRQKFHVREQDAVVLFQFTSAMSGPGTEEMRQGMFGPELGSSTQAPIFERVLANAGRDSGWKAGR